MKKLIFLKHVLISLGSICLFFSLETSESILCTELDITPGDEVCQTFSYIFLFTTFFSRFSFPSFVHLMFVYLISFLLPTLHELANRLPIKQAWHVVGVKMSEYTLAHIEREKFGESLLEYL